MKTTSNVRQPKNIKSGIAPQPLIGSYFHFKLKMKKTSMGFNWQNRPNQIDPTARCSHLEV